MRHLISLFAVATIFISILYVSYALDRFNTQLAQALVQNVSRN